MIDFTRDELGYVLFPTHEEQYAKEYIANLVAKQKKPKKKQSAPGKIVKIFAKIFLPTKH